MSLITLTFDDRILPTSFEQADKKCGWFMLFNYKHDNEKLSASTQIFIVILGKRW